MGKFDDSFGIVGDLPTNDELGLVEEEQEDDSEHEKAPPTSRRKRSSLQQQELTQGDVMEGMAQHHNVVTTHGRWIVVLVLCLSAAGMGITTFRYIARTEREEFEATVSLRKKKTTTTKRMVSLSLSILESGY